MNFKHSWTRRLKYVFPIMMMLGTLFGLKTANVFAEKVIVDPSNPIQNVKNNFIIPKDVPNAKTNITVNGASKVYKYHVDANKGGFTDDYVGLVEGNKNIRYPSFQKEYGETNLVLEGVTTNTKVNIDYGKIGTYNGKKVNIKLVLSNIHLYSDEKGRGFVRETEATPEDKKRIESGQIEVIKKPYYTIEKVFDITQTQLKPEDYPKIFPNRVFDFQLDKTGQTELQVGIQAVAKNIGIQIRDMTESEVYQRELGQARGAYVRNEFTGEEEIVMNTRNTPTQHLATSIHELAHARMHKFSELDTATKELQAEMTSYIVCKHFGMDTSEKAIPYIATWTKNGQTLDDKEAAERGKIMNDVSRVANEFIQTISNEINQYREREPEIQPAEVKQEHKNTLETPENKNIVPVGSLWIDKKDGKVMEEDTGRTLHLKDAAFIEDPQHNQVILKGKSYGKEIQTALPSEEFALGNPFRFSLETVSEVAKRKNEIYYEQQLSQKERV